MVVASDQKPTPDPTILTTEQLLREVKNATDLLEAKLDGLEREFAEKFHSVETQFQLVERQRVEQKVDTEKSVTTAFSAAKEAVREQTTSSDRAIAKSEASMLEQLKQLGTTFATEVGGLRRELGDLKDRTTGAEAQKVGSSQTFGYLFPAIGAIGVIAALVALLSK